MPHLPFQANRSGGLSSVPVRDLVIITLGGDGTVSSVS